jgi:hypothetical protein
MSESRYYTRHFSSWGSVLAEAKASGVGVLTPLGAIELLLSHGDPYAVKLHSPDAHRLILVPEVANSVQVQVDGYPSHEELIPPHPADSAIAKITDAIDDLRVEASLSRRADHVRSVHCRKRNSDRINGLCDKIQEALVECVTE